MKFIVWLTLLACSATQLNAQFLLPFKKNNLYGYLNSDGQVIVTPQFDLAAYYKNNQSLVIRNDSVFLFRNLELKPLIANVKKFEEFSNGMCGVQSKSGLWAVTDFLFSTFSEFEYKSLQNDGEFVLAKKINSMDVYNQKIEKIIPFNFNFIFQVQPRVFLCTNNESSQLFNYKNDSLLLLLDGENLFYNNAGIIQQLNKTKKQTSFYSINGKLLFECVSCSSERMMNNYVLFTDRTNSSLFDLRKNELLAQVNITNNFSLQTYPKLHLIDSINGKVYFNNREPIDFKKGKFLSFKLLDSNYYYLCNNEVTTVFDENDSFLFEGDFHQVNKWEDDVIICKNFLVQKFWSLKQNKFIFQTNANADISYDGNSFLKFQNGSMIVYNLDDDLNVIDSTLFTNAFVFRPGRKMIAQNNFSNLGINTNVNRYFYNSKIRRIGLKGFNNDTLVKAIFREVLSLNDSLDLAYFHSNKIALFKFRSKSNITLDAKVGVLNNRTGKFVIKPDFVFFSKSDFQDTSMLIMRAINVNRKFCFIDKASMTVIKGSECAYISEPEIGYFKVYKGLTTLLAEKKSYDMKLIPNDNLLSAISDFNYFGNANFVNRIYCEAKYSNLVDFKGNYKLDSSLSRQVKCIFNGKNSNFVFNSKANLQGVYNVNDGVIIQALYTKISRLTFNDSFFVLELNEPKYGYLNSSGNVITEAIYSKAEDFHNGFAWCTQNDSILLIDSSGAPIGLNQKNWKKKSVSDGFTAVKLKKGWQIIDLDGNPINVKLYKDVRPFIEGFAAVKTKEGWGIIDENNNFVLDPKYERFEIENNGSIVLSNKNKFYFFARNGQLFNKRKVKGKLNPLNNELYNEMNSDFSRVIKNNGDLYSKKHFSTDLLIRNDSLFSIKKNRVLVYKNGKRISSLKHHGGYRSVMNESISKRKVDRKNSNVFIFYIPKSYVALFPQVINDSMPILKLQMKDFSGYVIVNLNLISSIRLNAYIIKNGNESYYLVDSLGNKLSNQQYTCLEYIGCDLFKASYFNDYGKKVTGVINRYGIWVIPARFEDIYKFNEGKAIYTNRVDFKLSDNSGNLISDNTFTDIEIFEGHFLLKTDDDMVWWHPQKGFLTNFD